MKNILLIGVGGTGSRAVDIFYKKYNELGNHNGNHITALVFDTDAGDIKDIDSATAVVMTDPASVGTICDRLGRNMLREWFPCDDKAVRSQEMLRGASQWRKKSYLAFLNLMNKPVERSKFIKALEGMVANPGVGCEIYVISSVAGGTGSGSFIPIALYAKRYLREKLGKDPIVNAMIALPEIYDKAQTPENRTKIYANAYAILRELNAINLVARNYNDGRTEQKKAPIKFRIGHPDDPNVGVLFDASDKRYWTPEAAPFSQVFLLDRIPTVESIEAHDIILANSLYTILCTDIGEQFDSEFSNHELLRSQNNGSNAIYAGISTSQVRFPSETVLDYIAHRKAAQTCDEDWMVLHKAVENKIHEMAREKKNLNKRFVLGDGEYAKIVLKEYQEMELNGNNENLVDIVDRCTALYDKEGNKLEETVVDQYMIRLNEVINSKVPSGGSMKKKAQQSVPKLTGLTVDSNRFFTYVAEENKVILNYFKNCVEEIKGIATGTADSILTLDAKKLEYASSDFAMNFNILTNGKKGAENKAIHPVAALIQLCRFREQLSSELELLEGISEWDAFIQRNVSEVPSALLSLRDGGKTSSDGEKESNGAVTKNDNSEKIRLKFNKSFYHKQGAQDRFKIVSKMKPDNRPKKSDWKTDAYLLRADAVGIINNINNAAQKQLKKKVLTLVAANVDMLIDKYRSFFTRFEKEKDELKEAIKDVEKRDAGIVGGVINVYSSAKDKEAIYNIVESESGPVTEAEVKEMDNVVGRGVYETVYNTAVAAKSGDAEWNEKNSGIYRDIFGNMIKSYREFVKKSDAFKAIASYNVLEALNESCGTEASRREKDNELSMVFTNAQSKAKPSLQVNENGDLEDLVVPSTITVFMISVNTARYIKKHAEEFGLKLPDDLTNEKSVISSCAQQFVCNYSGNSGARVTIVDSIPDNMLYCTGEIMDITPLRISKFDELSKSNAEREMELNEFGLAEKEKRDDDFKDCGNLYYRCYCEALEKSKKYDTDMWNPHLGNDLHKRGYLPYMNESKEKECDDLVVKALIIAFVQGRINYVDGVAAFSGKYFFTFDGKRIRDAAGNWISEKNIAQLVAWMRDNNSLYEELSDKFDFWLRDQVNKLSNLYSYTDKDIRLFEGDLTKSAFMKLLSDELYTEKGKKVNLVEFAYKVKTTEEVGCDCDDAERIISVAYDIFKKLCGAKLDMDSNVDMFIQVYGQQLDKFYEAIKKCETAKGKPEIYKAIVTWLNNNKTFLAISGTNPIDSKGNVRIIHDYKVNGKDSADTEAGAADNGADA